MRCFACSKPLLFSRTAIFFTLLARYAVELGAVDGEGRAGFVQRFLSREPGVVIPVDQEPRRAASGSPVDGEQPAPSKVVLETDVRRASRLVRHCSVHWPVPRSWQWCGT